MRHAAAAGVVVLFASAAWAAVAHQQSSMTTHSKPRSFMPLSTIAFAVWRIWRS